MTFRENNDQEIKYLTNYKRSSYTVADFYISYINYINDNDLYFVDYKTFKDIVTTYFKYQSDQVLNSKCFKLPARLGDIQIVKNKPKTFTKQHLSIDFDETRKLGKTVYHLNEHSNYYKFRVYWCKNIMFVKNKSHYQFIFTRSNKRMLAHYIKNNKQDYIEF